MTATNRSDLLAAVLTTLLRTSAVLALTAGLATGLAGSSHAADADRWSPDLGAGQGSAVVTGPGGVRLDARPGRGTEQLGLLTLAPHELTIPTDRIRTALRADVPAGATATVDVRGREAGGEWGEWVPADPDGEIALPEPSSQVQGRIVLTGGPAAAPVVRAVDLQARPAARPRIAMSAPQVLRYRVFATREGLVGGTTANGHVITETDHFVALPSRRALAPKDTGDYTVRVCTARRCGYAPVWDVGPWNTRDDYWNPADVRQEWAELPQGMPQAQLAHLDGFNGGLDQFGREVLNPAGIDLSDAFFYDLGLDDNAWVRVDYLWTGSGPLGTVGQEPVTVRAAADPDAAEVGFAGRSARIPARCLVEGPDGPWLRIDDGQYVPAGAVSWARQPDACAPQAPAPVTVQAAVGAPGSAAEVRAGTEVQAGAPPGEDGGG
ncbi:hypothetical protein [Pseudonocardia sp.]|uniref:hypothetical protein n=1 Tax=Pseudonocardia sp. TaxID=60912 RepID=UPI003D0A92E3